MIKALAFLLVMLPAGAVTPNPLSCWGLLSAKAEASRSTGELSFNQVIGLIRASGAGELLAPLDSAVITPVFYAFRLPWQSMLSGREGWRGKLTLKVRGFKFANEKEKQAAVWETAMSLFELQSRASLWSRRSMLTPDDRKQFDLSMKGSDQNFEYFMVSQPAEWRDRQLRRLEILENELYRLFGSLDQLKAEDLLPKKDPGRFWIARAAYGGDASRSIAPNLADFEIWKNGGAPPALSARHGRSLIFNYYMNFMKRAVILGMLGQVVMAAPGLPNLPGYLDAIFSFRQFTQELSAPPVKTEEFSRRYVENLKKSVIDEEERLKKAIESGQSAGNPEKELSELYDLYPWLIHAK